MENSIRRPKAAGARHTKKRHGVRRRSQTTGLEKTALGEEPPKRGLKAKTASSSMSQKAHREMAVKVKTAKGRKLSSTLWLQRQLNDPYVARAKADGYRSRAAYKLIEIQEKFKLLKPGDKVVDLGAAPGGWCQVAVQEVGSLRSDANAKVIGIDYLGMQAVAGAQVLALDFLDTMAPDLLKKALQGQANVVLSDMAAPSTGHQATDHLRVIALIEAALDFAEDVLAPGGHFLAKVFQGGTQHEILARLKTRFEKVTHIKPKASRAGSPEMYVVAFAFKGKNSQARDEKSV